MPVDPALYKPLNDFFDHIYVITLKRASERHEKIKKELNGLNYHFFEATDYKDFSRDELISSGIYDPVRAKQNHRYGKEMRIGLLACTISHKSVYEDVLKNHYSRVLIFEDDVVPHKEGLQLFNEIIRELPSDWGVLYFDYSKNTTLNFFSTIKKQVYHIQKRLGHLNWSHKTIDNLFARPYSNHLKKAGYHDFASAYAITQKTAATLVKMQTPIIYFSDQVLPVACTEELVRGFISIPKLFIQQSQLYKEEVGSYVEEL
ncbi:MAG: glycosyltransferase family 25 protein [Bacteroidetes bacterium]|nr:glycosyltransferase family 25 protein [Bacteroidota bacterium]